MSPIFFSIVRIFIIHSWIWIRDCSALTGKMMTIREVIRLMIPMWTPRIAVDSVSQVAVQAIVDQAQFRT